MTEVKELFEEGLQLVTPLRWKDRVQHVINEEDKMMKLDHLIDNLSDSFIISVTYSGTTSSSETE